MKPAYHIPLRPTTLQLIGQICAIQGQVEWAMQNTVREILKVDNETVQRVMGSTSIATNAEIWIRLIRKTLKTGPALRHAEQAFTDLRELAEGRNDFVHAVYMRKARKDSENYFVYYEGGQEWRSPENLTVAMRVRNRKVASVAKLRDIRDIASAISIRVAHVHWMAIIRRRLKEPSPWLDRLAELPPLPPPIRAARQAKGQQRQPRSSRAKRQSQ